MVDHTFVYTGAVRKIKQLLSEGTIGRLLYFDSTRINLGLFQHDVNVIWDLAVHDFAIMDYLLDAQPIAVAASGAAHVAGQPESLAYVTCWFEGGLMAHFSVNWLAPVKIRRTIIGGDTKMIVYDDLETSEKVRVYDKGINLISNPDDIYNMLISYRIGDMYAPSIDPTEALHVEATHFVDCIERGQAPLTDGHAGRRVVRTLCAAAASLAESRPIELSAD